MKLEELTEKKSNGWVKVKYNKDTKKHDVIEASNKNLTDKGTLTDADLDDYEKKGINIKYMS